MPQVDIAGYFCISLYIIFSRCFKNDHGLRTHLNTCKPKAKKKRPNEVWLVPDKETKSVWDYGYVTKEMFANVLGLKLTGIITDDDDLVMTESIENEMLQDENVNIEPEPAVNETETENSKGTTEINMNERQDENVNIEPEPEVNETETNNSQETIELNMNEKQDHDSEKVENQENEKVSDFPCTECGKTFKTRKAQKDHETDIHSGRHECTLCPSIFTSKRHLNRHVKEVHRKHEEIAMCCGCGKTVSSFQMLHKHEQKCLDNC